MEQNLSIGQKILLLILYCLIILMLIFSIGAMTNVGEDGYNKCVNNKCERNGLDYCNKFREISNCCLGAGGEVAMSEGKYICVF